MCNQIQKYGSISDWIYVYKNYISNEELEKDLSINIFVNDDGFDRLEKVSLYENIKDQNNNDIVIIPRYCKLGLKLLENNRLIDNRTDGEDINIVMNVKPRDKYQENAISSMILNEHGILKAKTAFGKTYVAINAISKLKKKALIFAHKTDLVDQWKDSFIKYTNLQEDDIQIFSGDKFDPNKPITITTVQNIAAKVRLNKFNIREEFYKANFGITIFDECHTSVGPLINSQSTRWAFSKRIYGLSATPERNDDYDKFIKYLIGNIIYNDDREMLPVFVSFAPVSVEVPNNMKIYFSKAQKQYTNRYDKWLSKQDKYVDFCAQVVYSLIKHNKKILSVAAIKILLEKIYEKTQKIIEDNNENLNKILLIHGTSERKFEELKNFSEEEINNFNCVFSTNKYFSDGLSIDWLDTIIYFTAPSAKSLCAIPQLVGRIVRDYKGKEFVNVIDIYNDTFNIEIMRKKSREKSYKNFEYNVLSTLPNSIDDVDQYINLILNTSKNLSKPLDIL